MKDNKSRDIFYGIVAVATLIVALIGATLAYFSISTSSNEGVVNATAKVVSVDFKEGKIVALQAKNLIPSEFSVVKSVYEANKASIDNDNSKEEYGEEDKNRCTDINGQEVCSVYRFSISSNNTIEGVTATLNTEYNGFEYLAYAVRDADCVSTDGSNCWLDLKTNDGTTKTETESLSKCDNAAESDADKCYTTNSEGTKVFNSEKALSSIFGYGEDGADGTKTFNSIKLNANVNDNNVKTYDLVLFIKENWSPQNSDQGARYNGSITVEVAGAGIITGRIE